MKFLPVCLNMEGKRILVIGGGRVAHQKLKTLTMCAGEITVCAKEIIPGIHNLPVKISRTPYDEKILDGFHIVYACTDDASLNRKIGEDCGRRRLLVCVTDDPGACDFISPAICRKGRLSVAVSSDGRDVKGAIAIRDRIRKFLPDL